MNSNRKRERDQVVVVDTNEPTKKAKIVDSNVRDLYY